MAKIDYAALKKGGFMRQKQKGYFCKHGRQQSLAD